MVADREGVREVARRLARRAGITRVRPAAVRRPVPHLQRATGTLTRSPAIWVLSPDFDRPSGGVRKLYRAVDVLEEAGLPAAIVHEQAGFACTWFEHRTRILGAADVRLGADDVVVVPEIYWPVRPGLPDGIRQVIYNQNAYVTLDALTSGGAAAASPYVGNPDLAAVLVVSDENADVLRYAFPGVPVKRIRHGFDPAIHRTPSRPPARRIAYMPRRRPHEAAQVLRLLELRGVLDRWDVVAIDGRSEAEVAEALRASQIFLSFSEREGFGLPPCEALACGCLVVGFDGFAGREFFRPPFARTVHNGDVVGFARAVEDLVLELEADPAAGRDAAAAGSHFVHEHYSPAAERDDLTAVFTPLVAA